MNYIQVSKLNTVRDGNNIFDEFIDHSINGTIFHKQKFLAYHGDDKFVDNSLLFYSKNKLIAVFPAVKLRTKENQLILKSHAGSSYGGLILCDIIGISDTFLLIESLICYAKENNFNAIEFRLSEKIFYKKNLDTLDFCLLHKGFFREAEELSNAVDLKQFKNLNFDDYLNSFSNNSKNKVLRNYRVAQKYFLTSGFSSLESEVVEFYTILEKTLQKFKVTPVHSLPEIFTLLQTCSEIRLFIVKYENKIIAGQFVFDVNSQGSHMFYNALDYDYKHTRAANFGMVNLIYQLTKENKKYYNLGISTENSGKIINYGLFDFKESFNSEGVIRTYWKKQL